MVEFFPEVNERLGARLRTARTGKRLTLQVAAEAANVSTAYLHKLEAGRVKNPSPRVLHRLAGALGLSYATLMELAGYVVPRRKEEKMNPGNAPTNEQIVRLLEALSSDVRELNRRLDELAKALRASGRS
jgi:transcriptional regulator with XRE-family HTH domain